MSSGGGRGRLRLLGPSSAPIVAALAALAIATAHTCAVAQPAQPAERTNETSDEAIAESLFEAGRKLMADGQVAEACPKFEESNRIAPSAGTLLNLGRCFELQGKTASAWVVYKKAVGLARATGQTRHVTAGEKFIADITPHLSRLRVEAPDPPRGLVVSRGGAPMGAASLGVPLVVDPGDQTLEATAPGREKWSSTVTVKPDGDDVVVTIPSLGEVAGSTAPPPHGTGADGAAHRDPAPTGEGMPPVRLAGLVVGGVGVATLGVGIAFGVMTLSDASAAEGDAALCPAKACSPAGEDAISSAETKAWVSNITIGVGAAAVVAGGALVAWSFLTPAQPSKRGALPRPEPWARAAPWATADGAGIVIGGAL